MAYDIRKTRTGKYVVIDQHSGESIGDDTYVQRSTAERHLRALQDSAPRRHTTPGADAGGGLVLDSSYQPTFGESYIDGRRVVVSPVAPVAPVAPEAVPGKE
jgi:hypothetical protein